MPKLKSNRGAAKRFRATGTGKVRRNRSHHQHILSKKTTKRKRGLRHSVIASPADERLIKILLPYL